MQNGLQKRKQQAEDYGPPNTGDLKTIYQIRCDKNNNGIDDQQKKTEGDNGNG